MSVLTTFVSVTQASKEANLEVSEPKLQQVLYIHYPTQFSEFPVKAFIDSGSKVNIMQISFARKLSFCICKPT